MTVGLLAAPLLSHAEAEAAAAAAAVHHPPPRIELGQLGRPKGGGRDLEGRREVAQGEWECAASCRHLRVGRLALFAADERHDVDLGDERAVDLQVMVVFIEKK